MSQRILIIDGHPDPAGARLVHALAQAYREGAEAGMHEVLTLRVADLSFPLLRTQADYENGEPSPPIRDCQSKLDWATHVVIVYPLWLGSMPAMLKGLLEQALRPNGTKLRLSATSAVRQGLEIEEGWCGLVGCLLPHKCPTDSATNLHESTL